jgi:site-specific DNA-methyltransferase (adenine-specific)
VGNLSKAIQDHNKGQTDLFGTIIIPPKPRSRAVKHLSIIEKNDEWGTPFEMLRNAVDEFQISPKLDVCANFYNKKFDYYFTKEDNALTKEWDEDFFMNPPYSKVKLWVEKAYNEHKKHNVNGLALLYSKTDTKYWHDFIEGKAEIHSIKGRVKFVIGGRVKKSAPYPSCWVIWRKK